jgi:methyl coenzyme M reductase subunit C
MRNDSTEILVIAADPEAPKNIGSKPTFEVKYGMKEEHIEVP